METDFLISKKRIPNRHNILPIEVKSGKKYTLTSINKFKNKYKEQLDTAYVIHVGDLKVENDIIYIPIYDSSIITKMKE